MIKVIRGSDKDIIVRLQSQTSQDPYDLTNVEQITASFKNEDETCLIKFYIKKTGIISIGSDIVTSVDTTDMAVDMPVVATGIPGGALITQIISSTSFKMSVLATASSSVTLEVGDISIITAILGKIKIQLHEADTDGLALNEAASFELGITRSGFQSFVQFIEQLNIVARLC